MLKPVLEEQPRRPTGKGLRVGRMGDEGGVVHKDKEFEWSSKCKGKGVGIFGLSAWKLIVTENFKYLQNWIK